MLHILFGVVHNILSLVLIKEEVKLFLKDISVLPKAKPFFLKMTWNIWCSEIEEEREGEGGKKISRPKGYIHVHVAQPYVLWIAVKVRKA